MIVRNFPNNSNTSNTDHSNDPNNSNSNTSDPIMFLLTVIVKIVTQSRLVVEQKI